MILSWFVRDPKVRAKKRSPEFGDQLLHRVEVIAEAIPKLAIKAARMAGPVDQLMQVNRVEAFRRRAPLGIDEILPFDHLDQVVEGTVAAAIAPVLDPRLCRLDERFGVRERLRLVGSRCFGRRPSLDLRRIEDPRCSRDETRLRLVIAFGALFRFRVTGTGVAAFVEDDNRAA